MSEPPMNKYIIRRYAVTFALILLLIITEIWAQWRLVEETRVDFVELSVRQQALNFRILSDYDVDTREPALTSQQIEHLVGELGSWKANYSALVEFGLYRFSTQDEKLRLEQLVNSLLEDMTCFTALAQGQLRGSCSGSNTRYLIEIQNHLTRFERELDEVTAQYVNAFIPEFYSVEALQFVLILVLVAALIISNSLNLRAVVRYLKDEEEKFRALAHNTQAIVAIVQDNQFVYVNPTLARVTGYSGDELRQMPPSALAHPDHMDVLQALQNGETSPERFELKVRHKDASARWLDVASNPIVLNGKMAYVVTALDITERKQIETELEENQRFTSRITAVIPDWIHIFDLNQGRYIYNNRPVILDLGYRADEFDSISAGVPVHLYHPDEIEMNALRFAEIYQAVDSQVIASEYRLKAKTGEWHWISTRNAIFARNPDGTPSHILGVSRDITDRKQAEESAHDNENRFRNLWAESQRQGQELKLVGQVRATLAAELDLQPLIRRAVEAIAETFGYALVSLYLLEDETLKLQHQVGFEQFMTELPRGTGISWQAIQAGVPVLVEDVTASPDFVTLAGGVTSQISIPLRDGETITGVLNIESQDGVVLTEADLKLMTGLGEHINVALSRARLYSKLQDSQEFIQRITDLIPDSIYLYDLVKDRGIYQNPVIETLMGYSVAEVLSRTIGDTVDLIHPDDQLSVYTALANLPDQTATPIHEFEYRMKHKEGNWRWLRTRMGVFIRDSNGVPTQFINISSDITSRKQAEDEVRESRNLLRSVLDTIPVNVFWKDQNGVYLGLNQRFAETLKLANPETIVGKTDYDLVSADEAHMYQVLDCKVMETGIPLLNVEEPARGITDATWMRYSRVPLRDSHGKLMGVLIVSEDISARKTAEDALRESQQRYQQLYEAIDDAIIIHDTESNILEVNEAACRRLEYTRDQLMRMKTGEIDDPEYAARFEERLRHQMVDGKLTNISGVHVAKSGRHINIDVNTTRITYQGKPAIFSIVRDVTELKRIESELRRSEEQLRRLYNESQRQALELNLLAEVRNAISRETEPQPLIRQVVEAVSDTFGYRLVSVYLREGDRLKLQHQVGYDRVLADIPVTAGVSGRVVASGQPVLIQDTRLDPDFLEAIPGITSEICVPLMDEGQVIGTLNIESLADYRLSQDDLHLMVAIGEFVSIALGRARLYDTLVHERALLRTVIDSIPSKVFYVDTQCRYVLNNIADARFKGAASVEAMAGKTVYDFFPQELASVFYAENLRVLESEHPLIGKEEMRLMADGQPSWDEVSKIPLRDTAGKIIGLVGISHDITELKRAEQQLRDYAQEIEDLYNNAPCGYHSLSSDGTFLRINDTELNWLGYSREETIGKLKFADVVSESGKSAFHKAFPILVEQGQVKDLEYIIVRKDGSTFWGLLNATAVYDPNGAFVASRATMFDITERKRAEETLAQERAMLRTLIDNLPEQVCIKDNTYRFVINNMADARSMGVDDPQLLVGHTDHDYFPIEMADQFRTDDRIVIEEGRPVLNREERSFGEGGEARWVLTNKVPLRDLKGKVIGLVSASLDITERKQIELAEREQRALAEAFRDIARALTQTLDLDEVLDLILSNIGRVVPFDAAALMLVQGQYLRFIRLTGFDSPAFEKNIYERSFGLDDLAAVREMMVTGKPLVISDVSAYPGWVNMSGQPFKSYLAVPMLIEDAIVGFIQLLRYSPDFFNSVHLSRLQIFADQAAIAIQNARSYQHAQEIAMVEERQRLARELHDSVSQTLFSAGVVAETLPRIWEKQKPDDIRNALQQLNRLTRGAMAEMRTLLAELRPNALLETDLPTLLKHLTDAAAGHIQIPIILETEGQGKLPQDVQIAFYRIAQEALHNIIKYARAREVRVTYAYCAERISLYIQDDGRGFDLHKPVPGHYGLNIMRERAEAIGAQVEIISQPGLGTEIKVFWQPSIADDRSGSGR